MFRAEGSRSSFLSLTGRGRVPLPLGRYDVHVSRGPEYEVEVRRVTIAPGAVTEIETKLKRAIETPGFLAIDFHQHAANSFDSAVTLEDRVTSNAAEGLEVLVSSDHNHITDYGPVIEKLGLGRLMTSVVGNEATTMDIGHFNAWHRRRLRVTRAPPEPPADKEGAAGIPWL